MSLPDTFLTIKSVSEGEYKDKGSRFLAFAFAIKGEDDAKEWLKKLRKEHYAAAHVCWAFVLGCEGEIEKSSDDREPSGSAGKPILRALLERKLTFTLVAVVRYFGGKLLGVPGLIQAYGEAARDALSPETMIEKKVHHVVFQPCEFERQHEIIRVFKHHLVKFYPDVQDAVPGITFEVAPSKNELVLEAIQLLRLEKIIELKIIYT